MRNEVPTRQECSVHFILPLACWANFINCILQHHTCTVKEVGREAKADLPGERGAMFSTGAISWAWCLVDEGEGRTKDALHYSRTEVHSTATLCV